MPVKLKSKAKHKEVTDIFTDVGSWLGRMYEKISMSSLLLSETNSNHKRKIHKKRKHRY